MKFNWGWGIVLAFAGFIGFILYFVIIASTDKRANHHLVTDEYYQEELVYQNEIDAAQNASEFAPGFKVQKTEDGLMIEIPEPVKKQNVKGKVSLYRPSNEHLDFNLAISLSNAHLLIPDDRLLGGRWDIRIAWEYQGKNYLVKKSITY